MNKKQQQKFVQHNYKPLPKRLKMETHYLFPITNYSMEQQHMIQQIYDVLHVPKPVLPSEIQYYQYILQIQETLLELHLKMFPYCDFCDFVQILFQHDLQFLYVANIYKMDPVVAMMWMKIYCMMILYYQKQLYIIDNSDANKFVQIIYSFNDQFDLIKLYKENIRMRNEEDKQIRDVLFLNNQDDDKKDILLQCQQYPYNNLAIEYKPKIDQQKEEIEDKIIISQKISQCVDNMEFDLIQDQQINKLNNFAFQIQE